MMRPSEEIEVYLYRGNLGLGLRLRPRSNIRRFERLDEHFEKRPSEMPLHKRKPSEFLEQGRIFKSCEPGERGLATALETRGEGTIVFAFDGLRRLHVDGEGLEGAKCRIPCPARVGAVPLDRREAAEQGLEGHAALHSCNARTEAEMSAESEAHMPIIRPGDVEKIGIGVALRVANGRGKAHVHHAPGLELDAR